MHLIAASYERKQRENPESRITQITDIRAPKSLGDLEGYYNGKNFFIQNKDAAYQVPNHRLDPMLRQIKPNQLKALLANGHIKANQNDKGEYSLDAQGELKGSGPTLGFLTYIGVKVVGYTGLMLTTIAVNTLLPGAGTTGTAILMGTGGMAGALAAIESAAVSAGCAVGVLPTP